MKLNGKSEGKMDETGKKINEKIKSFKLREEKYQKEFQLTLKNKLKGGRSVLYTTETICGNTATRKIQNCEQMKYAEKLKTKGTSGKHT